MKVQRRQYTAEFKREAVRLVTEQGLSKAQVARDLGINDNLLARWQKQLDAAGAQAFPGQGNAQDAELARLRREVAVLRQERELLKKVVTIFAQPGAAQS
jgi:transposase